MPRNKLFELRIFHGFRKKHQLDDSLFATDGRLFFSNFIAVRSLAYMINAERSPELHVYPGELFAAGLLHEIYHVLLRSYEKQLKKDVFTDAAAFLTRQNGSAAFKSMMQTFTEAFPPTEVFKGKLQAAEHLEKQTGGISNTAIGLEELLMLFLANENPANKKLTDLFDESQLGSEELFDAVKNGLESFFQDLPPFGPENTDIISLFRAPFKHAPDNYHEQLNYVLTRWKHFLPEELLTQILRGRDLMKEDYMLSGGHGPPPAVAPDYKGKGPGAGMGIGKSGFDAFGESQKDYEEAERFTDDTDWMPRVVLLAKNTYVWLDQLSKHYGRDIRTLDQIPDEELDRLARWNFNGLWLIGVWERSKASKKIKHKMGNPDAVSSAYSLYDYEIAHDLGGEEAYRRLDERARHRGIRLASDMVPNHTGIYSKWVIEHPDYFIQSAVPPFPNYSFGGDNLSDDPNVEIRIEDGYYSKSDAAVVFQRIDRQNNDIRYLYHGNDGTMMPWNDTAQLDMLKAEVRQAVIDKIFGVARRFSIIRFDAAMTLAKKHFARLWYPRPGTGGDIPSRADHAMSQEAFDALFPVEFWREVVDRINNEMPETLLLAEAFWFMEGYFVRTLGMHRVYNSAFMHMLKNEENEKYRELITNTLEFEPEILKRYVNFMSNPDEETAIQQFGTGDKYFGICVMMNTLPGLPMFAHGQLEGYTEKYGMEYRRAYYNEAPNQWLIEKHEREIFPLTQRRYLFSEVRHFNIFGFYDGHGIVNENVFAYTNCHGHERALVFFNNKYDMARGHIKTAAPKLQKGSAEKSLVSVSLAEALMISDANNAFYIAREPISGLEYLFSADDIHHRGMYRELMGFEYRVFLDFREIMDKDGEVATLCDRLGGNGCRSVDEELALQRLGRVHQPFSRLFGHELFNAFIEQIIKHGDGLQEEKTRKSLEENFAEFAEQSYAALDADDKTAAAVSSFATKLRATGKAMAHLPALHNELNTILNQENIDSVDRLVVLSHSHNYRLNGILWLAYIAVESLVEHLDGHDGMPEVFKQLRLDAPTTNILAQSGKSADDVNLDMHLLYIMMKHGETLYDFLHSKLEGSQPDLSVTSATTRAAKAGLALEMLSCEHIRAYTGVNQYEGVWYFSKEKFEQLNRWLFSMAYHNYFEMQDEAKQASSPAIQAIDAAIRESVQFYLLAVRSSSNAGYKLNGLTERLTKLAKQ